jgi:hypothetical protein
MCIFTYIYIYILIILTRRCSCSDSNQTFIVKAINLTASPQKQLGKKKIQQIYTPVSGAAPPLYFFLKSRNGAPPPLYFFLKSAPSPFSEESNLFLKL